MMRRVIMIDKIEVRRQAILKMLEQSPMIMVSELASSLHVTMETIRKDLSVLEQKGLVVRIHGGAALLDRGKPIPYTLREVINKEGKHNIAKAACGLVKKGDTLILENSTTTVAFCHELIEQTELLQSLTIITNSFYIAQLFEMGALCKQLFFLGGWVTKEQHATQGAFTAQSLRQFQTDWAFLGGAALNRQFQLTAFYESDMFFQKEAIKAAAQIVVLLDNSKYGSSALYHVSDLDAVDYLVADIIFNEQELKLLEQKKVKLVYAG